MNTTRVGYQRLYKYIIDISITNKLEFSQSEIKRNIEVLGVSINGNLVFKQLYKVYHYDDISIEHWPQRESQPLNTISILYQNSEMLAIYKPRGVVSIPGAGHQLNNAQQELIKRTGITELTPINRIDKDTCGLMLFATNELYQKKYQDLFRKREVDKEYFALVNGLVEKQFHMTHYQCRSKHDVKKQILFFNKLKAYEYSQLCRKAVTTVKPFMICKEKNVSLVKVKIHTGRMHQIRLLLEHLGYPLYNEKVYNQTLKNPERIHGVFVSVKEVTVEKIHEFINNIKRNAHETETVSNPADLSYFLCSYYLSFTDNDAKPPKNYLFDLSV